MHGDTAAAQFLRLEHAPHADHFGYEPGCWPVRGGEALPLPDTGEGDVWTDCALCEAPFGLSGSALPPTPAGLAAATAPAAERSRADAGFMSASALALHAATLALFACHEPGRLPTLIAEQVAALLGGGHVWVATTGADPAAMTVTGATARLRGADGERVRYGIGLAGRAWQTRAPAIASPGDPENAPGDAALPAAVVLPLVHETDALGVIGLVTGADESATFDAAEIGLVSRFAQMAALALANAAVLSAARREVQAHRHRESMLRYQATHDALTGLPNRTLLDDRLCHAIQTAERTAQPFTLLFIDLDRFKEVNDTLGHQMGDRLLERVGARLRNALRESDTVARLGGDEFAILLPTTGATVAQVTASKVSDQFARPFVIDGYSLEVGASIGLAVFPEDGATAELLIRCADEAMYSAKRSGGGVRTLRAGRAGRGSSRLSLAGDLRAGLEAGEIGLEFQPIVATRPAQAPRVAALARWRHPRLGAIPPARFIPLAEQTGLAGALTRRLLADALRCCHDWDRDGFGAEVTVNLSPRTLHDATLPGVVDALLDEHSLAPGRLQLVVGAAALATDSQRTRAALQQLRGAGARLVIAAWDPERDSPAAFARLPVEELKLDGHKLAAQLTSANGALALRAAIALAHALGLRVTAAGVESEAMGARLTALGCDALQGGGMGTPRSAAAIAVWLADQKAR